LRDLLRMFAGQCPIDFRIALAGRWQSAMNFFINGSITPGILLQPFNKLKRFSSFQRKDFR
jgi:hypothetical protein